MRDELAAFDGGSVTPYDDVSSENGGLAARIWHLTGRWPTVQSLAAPVVEGLAILIRDSYAWLAAAAGRVRAAVWQALRSHPRVVRGMDIAATVLPLLVLLLSAIVQLAHPGYNPLQQAVSLLVWGPLGGVQTAAFFLLGFSILTTIIRVFLKMPTTVRFRVGIGLYALTAVGIIIVGMHPTDLPGAEPTLTGLIHLTTAGSMIFIFPAAAFLMAPHLGKTLKGWLAHYTRAAGGAAIALIAVVAVVTLARLGWFGTVERLILVNGVAWMQIVNFHLL